MKKPLFFFAVSSFSALAFFSSGLHAACYQTGSGRPQNMSSANRSKIRYAFVGRAMDICKQDPTSPECRNTEVFTITVPPNDYCSSHPNDSQCKGTSLSEDMSFYAKLCNEAEQKEHFRQVYELTGNKENCHRTCDIIDSVGVKSYQVTVASCPSTCPSLCFTVCDYQ